MARAALPPPLSSPKGPAIAALLSIIPGLGQLYLGQRGKGLLLLLTIYPFFIFSTPISVIDAFVLARRLRRGSGIYRWEWFWNREAKRVWTIAEVREMGRREQPIGKEARTIDNSRSDGALSRTLKISREWSSSYKLEHEREHKTVNTSSIELKDGASKSRSIEDSLTDRFSYTHGLKHIHEESIHIEVPARHRLVVVLDWKNILEVGVVVLKNQYDESIELPFSIVVGVTFDQEHLEERYA
jgi:hypothetical protein